MTAPIKVLLVEDSPVALGVYQKIMESSPEIRVVGTARDGVEALSLISTMQPQVICTDLLMPNMDGLELIKQVMAHYPLPILVLSNVVQKHEVDNIYKVLKAGAVDVLPKPQATSSTESEEFKKQLVTKIRILATKQVFPKPLK